MTEALHLVLARQLLTVNARAADYQNRSPLLNLICNKISIALSLLQLAQTSIEIKRPGGEEARNMAERAYSQALGYAALLPQNERTSAAFKLGRLRIALDEFPRS